MKTAITAAALFTQQDRIERPVVIIEDGVISALGPRDAIDIPTGAQHFDFPDAVLAPGFVDVHIHGAAGHDVMEGDDSALAALESFLAKHGVTSYCPTTVTAPLDKTLAALEKLGKAVRNHKPNSSPRACPVGIHLEGPFISSAKCGVHPLADITPPSLELFEKFWETSQGTIRMMTIAPELPGADELIRAATARGVCVSLGHSDADTASTHRAIDAGARHVTHTFNAMRRLDHREPGILGVALSDKRLMADIIVDGVHVAPEVVKLFLAAKRADFAVLITDAISATGMPDGRYRLGTIDVEVKGIECRSNGRLAGSVLTMDLAIRNVMKFSDWDLQRALRLATQNPARLLGIDSSAGSLAVGKAADIVVLTPDGQPIKTLVGGFANLGFGM